MTTIDPRYRAELLDAPRAGVREWLALGVLMLPVLLTSIDNTVLSFALPQVSIALRLVQVRAVVRYCALVIAAERHDRRPFQPAGG